MDVVVPKDAAEHPPLLVFLHGRSGDAASNLSSAMYDGLADQGERAPIVAFPDGGGDKYWHDRASGGWGSWVVDEVIPEVVDEFGADPKRVAIGGISMGGFGAFDLARLHPGRFCAVGGHSPALWVNGGDSAAGAFDDAADFSRHDVIATAESDPAKFEGPALWVDAGKEDPFQPGVQAFEQAIESAGIPISAHSPPGGHEGEYWSAHWDEYLGFYAEALAHCDR